MNFYQDNFSLMNNNMTNNFDARSKWNPNQLKSNAIIQKNQSNTFSNNPFMFLNFLAVNSDINDTNKLLDSETATVRRLISLYSSYKIDENNFKVKERDICRLDENKVDLKCYFVKGVAANRMDYPLLNNGKNLARSFIHIKNDGCHFNKEGLLIIFCDMIEDDFDNFFSIVNEDGSIEENISTKDFYSIIKTNNALDDLTHIIGIIYQIPLNTSDNTGFEVYDNVLNNKIVIGVKNQYGEFISNPNNFTYYYELISLDYLIRSTMVKLKINDFNRVEYFVKMILKSMKIVDMISNDLESITKDEENKKLYHSGNYKYISKKIESFSIPKNEADRYLSQYDSYDLVIDCILKAIKVIRDSDFKNKSFINQKLDILYSIKDFINV